MSGVLCLVETTRQTGSVAAPKTSMRALVIVLIIAGLGFVFWRQKESEVPPAPGQAAPAQVAGSKPTPAALTPAPRGQASKYNFMKRALDRARDVTEQSRAQTQESQNP
jgi:hypothetical protein